MIDIIPDIHGQYDKLESLLTRLGYRLRGGAWRHSDPGRSALFLGDYIDRGPRNRDTLDTVRGMVEAGAARAIMGNHELNAIRFHATDLGAPAPLRPHSAKNLRQHRSFLDEFADDPAGRRAALDFFCTLPLYVETGGLRAVHAAWSDRAVAAISAAAPGGVVSAEMHLAAADPAHPLHLPLEVLAKGPEIALPPGSVFVDKDGSRRTDIRVAWWHSGARTYREAAISVPEGAAIPELPLPCDPGVEFYPEDAPPVFFGHYWLTGAVRIEAPNALCLDYSAGLGGPLVAYCMEDPAAPLSVERIVTTDE